MKNILYILFFISFVLPAQQLAFETAYGAGAYTTGGRGGSVIHVTNLNDSGTGSLRWALTDASHQALDRTIVFDISGVIQLNTVISMGSEHTGGITINGFTAPLGGITVIGQMFRMTEANNVIIRGMRFRGGYNNTDPNNAYSKSSFLMTRTNGAIVDHCSTGFALEQSIGGSGGDTGITFQNNLIGNTARVGIVGQGITSSQADRIDNMQVSYLRTVMADVGWRQPNVAGNTRADLVNNYLFNWDKQLSAFTGSSYTDDPTRTETTRTAIIGNYYDDGANTRVSAGNNSSDPLKRLFRINNTNVNPQFYMSDNHISSFFDLPNFPAQPETAFRAYNDDGTVIQSAWFNYTLADLGGLNGRAIPILSSQDLKTEIFPTVGACYYTDDNGNIQFYRDAIDTELITRADTKATTVETYNYQIRAEALLPAGTDPMPSATRPGNFYQSNPHIPEAWLVAKGITGDTNIHNQVQASGYTLLEEYINQVDELLQGCVVDTADNLISEPCFETNTTWTITGNAWNFDGLTAEAVAVGYLINTTNLPLQARDYNLSYEITESNNGEIRLAGGNSAFGIINNMPSTVGTHTVPLTSNGTAPRLQFLANGFIGKLDNVSLVEQECPIINENLISNGCFNGDTDWSFSNVGGTFGWRFSDNGTLICDANATTANRNLQQYLENPLEIGETYRVTLDIVQTSDAMNFILGGVTTVLPTSTTIGYIFDVIATSTTNVLTIYAGSSDLQEVDNISIVKLPPVNVTAVEVTPSTLSLKIGESSQLVRTFPNETPTDQTGNWGSSNGTVASTDQNGNVTGLSTGTSTVTYTSNDGAFTDTCVITVTANIGNRRLRKKEKLIIINQ